MHDRGTLLRQGFLCRDKLFTVVKKEKRKKKEDPLGIGVSQLSNDIVSTTNMSELTILHTILCFTNNRLTITMYAYWRHRF